LSLFGDTVKYGVKVPFVDGGYLWVTEGDSKFHLRPRLFDSVEDAERLAAAWNSVGQGAVVAEYEENEPLV